MKVQNIRILMNRMIICLDEYEETSFYIMKSAWRDHFLVIIQHAHDEYDPEIRCWPIKKVNEEFGIDIETLLPKKS